MGRMYGLAVEYEHRIRVDMLNDGSKNLPPGACVEMYSDFNELYEHYDGKGVAVRNGEYAGIFVVKKDS